MTDKDTLTHEIHTIGSELQKVAQERERLTERILNPEESRTELLASQIERLAERERVLKDLYIQKDMQLKELQP